MGAAVSVCKMKSRFGHKAMLKVLEPEVKSSDSAKLQFKQVPKDSSKSATRLWHRSSGGRLSSGQATGHATTGRRAGCCCVGV